METPPFWKGGAYGSTPAKPRTLILGESHYVEQGQKIDVDFTTQVVKERAEKGFHPAFFGTVEQIVSGRMLSSSAVSGFWGDHAFMNYAPHPVDKGKVANEGHFAGAQKRLKLAIEELEPDLVCFFSSASWHRRPWGGPDWSAEAFGYPPRDLSRSVTLYPFRERAIIMAAFKHPRSLGVAIDVWQAWYRNVAELAQAARSGALR